MGFNHLKKLEIKDKIARFSMPMLGDAVLIVKPATEANKPYFNKVLKRSRKKIRAAKSGIVNTAILEDGRDEDRELFPLHVIVGWKQLKDDTNEYIEYSLENCQRFLEVLPNWLFDEVRNFAADPSNFVELMDVEEKAGN